MVVLNPGSVVTLRGDSKIAGFIEILCDSELLSAFEEDVLERGVTIEARSNELRRVVSLNGAKC